MLRIERLIQHALQKFNSMVFTVHCGVLRGRHGLDRRAITFSIRASSTAHDLQRVESVSHRRHRVRVVVGAVEGALLAQQERSARLAW